ncbi:GNAT family N-acetyltransferase [Flavobacteriaceae bacterium]|nr:GNAT family N-acetyltransferase [Flavobacteriaceae bacterium]MDB4496080.1 GNAT family N-acetyltransferase [Flavobacteriaceae bacterium]MDB4560456.1 GNAT family N-acetyltransferase [Flavobacteriaceae bacterium]
MIFTIKKFNELSTHELYAVLQLRAEVFVVEQDCVYQDLDNKDLDAYHMLGVLDTKIVAYARIFKPGDYFLESSIGRIVVKKEFRKFQFGYQLVVNSIQFIENNLQQNKILISAQSYLSKFYNSLGFTQVGEEYLEDGIPHIKMLKS